MKSRPAQVFLLSVAVICHQLALMRALSLARTFHFAYLVIGVALLGFGASGVALRLALPAVGRRPDAWRLVLYSLSCVSLPLGYALAMALPLDLQFLLHGGSQAPLLLACVCCLFVPFFFLAFLIGMELSQAGQAIPGVYAANLWGSGLGGLAGIGLAAVVPTIRLPLVTGAIVLAALLAWMVARPAGGGSTGRLARIVAALACGGATAVAIAVIPAPRIDQYKALAGFQQLAAQGDAEALVSRSGVRAQVDVYASARLHQTLFAGIQATALPPRQIAFLLDGDLAGVAFAIAGPGEAAILDATPQSLAYRLVDSPRVLILGEVGGTNVWLARRFGASSITVVQGHPGLVRLMRGGLSGRYRGRLQRPWRDGDRRGAPQLRRARARDVRRHPPRVARGHARGLRGPALPPRGLAPHDRGHRRVPAAPVRPGRARRHAGHPAAPARRHPAVRALRRRSRGGRHG